jgi:5,10-methylenetetrahydromethanopterin reductase
VGIRRELPLTRVLETIQVLRRLFDGESVEFEGRTLRGWRPEAYLRFPSHPVPIYVGAMSPRMLRAIGRVADGGLPLLFPPEHFATVMTHIRAGLHEARRAEAEVDVAACIWCSVAADGRLAEDVLRDKIAYYGASLSPLILDALGVERRDFEPIRAAIAADRDPVRARAMVTPRMLRIGVAGTARQLVPRLEALVKLGAQHLSFGPPLGPDPLAAIELLGREVLPYFR